MAEFDENNEKVMRENLVRKAVMLKMRRNQHWSGNFGLITALGGVIILPIVIGILTGTYLDNHFPITFSWKLSLIFCGFVWGMANAYFWIKTEIAKSEAVKKEFNDKIDKEMH